MKPICIIPTKITYQGEEFIVGIAHHGPMLLTNMDLDDVIETAANEPPNIWDNVEVRVIYG